ncbi:MAG: hypothetical protein JWN03_8996 [Nocardia sp.]|nr:hypothetical protein [Nocardia sp.]
MTGETDQQPPSVVLVGPPGAGKSTIGRKLARELGVDLYDTDAGIEEQTGRTIPEIFAEDGEPEFRRIEEQVVRDAVLAGHGIISLGGGSVLSATTRELLRGRTVVYLEISVGEGLRRTGASTNRPLLNGADPAAKYRELMKIRRPLYREVASVRVRTDGRSPGRVVKMILGKLGLESTLPQEDTTPELPVVPLEPNDSSRSRSRRRRRRGRSRADNTAPTQPNAAAPEAVPAASAQPNPADPDSETGPDDATTKPARRGRRSRRRSRRPAGPATGATTIDATDGSGTDAVNSTATGAGRTASSGTARAAGGASVAGEPRPDSGSATTGSAGSDANPATAATLRTEGDAAPRASTRGGRRRAAANRRSAARSATAEGTQGTAGSATAAAGTPPAGGTAVEATRSAAADSTQAGGVAANPTAEQQDSATQSAPGAGRSRRARARRARARARTGAEHGPEQSAREESEQPL